jgi:hypothetical protein
VELRAALIEGGGPPGRVGINGEPLELARRGSTFSSMPQVGSIGQRTPLARGRDAIVSRQWSITPHGTAPAAPTLTGATTDTVAVSGMLAGCCYRLIEHVVTSSGLEDDPSVQLRCDHT